FSGDLTNSTSDQAEAGDHRVGKQGVQGGGDSAEDEDQTACGFVESDDVLDKGAEPGNDVADGGTESVGRFPESDYGVDGPVEQFGDPFKVALERAERVRLDDIFHDRFGAAGEPVEPFGDGDEEVFGDGEDVRDERLPEPGHGGPHVREGAPGGVAEFEGGAADVVLEDLEEDLGVDLPLLHHLPHLQGGHAVLVGEHLEDADVGDVELVHLPHRQTVGGENLVDDLAGPLEVVAHERGGVAGQPQDPGEVLADFDPGGHRLRCRAGGGVQSERRAFDGV